jgi:rod shape-determining protein MreD
MNAVFFILLTLFLLVVQTIVLPCFSWFPQCFDLMIINVLFLSLIASRNSMVFAIAGIGCIMDSISGTPFGYYLFSYLWIYIIVRLARQLVFKQSFVFILIMSVAAVLIQHGLLVFSILVNHGQIDMDIFDVNLMMKQTLWGLVLIPAGIWTVRLLRMNWIYMVKQLQKQIMKKHRR